VNPIAKEIASYYGSSKMSEGEFLEHYGKGHLDGGHSGRYPWGSGEDPYQHSLDFLARISRLKENGWKETPTNIEKEFGLSVKEYRMEKTLCLNERRINQVATAERLRDKEHLNNTEIGKRMGGISESSVRSLFNEQSKKNMMAAKETANFLKEQVKEKKMIDVGVDTEIDLGISRTKLDTALYILQSEGYGVYNGRIPQPTNKDKQTTQKILCDKDIKPDPGKKVPKEIYQYDKIHSIKEYISRDNGETFEKKFNYPESMDSRRIKVVLKNEIGPDGLKGEQKDGLIEIRRGVPDLSLGESRYAQVRILVDKNKYLKGMAVYSDNIPDGYDIVFNSNKNAREDAFKKISNDPDNPFGSSIKDIDQGGQYWYDSKTGQRLTSKAESKNAKLGLINKRADESDWTKWKDALPSQFLSKQTEYMAKKQLDLAKADKLAEFDEIKSLTNPTIKKYYLDKFASECDAAAVDLKAAALPGQKYHVIIPVNTLTEKEVYAPQYKEGTKVALIRYPHGGKFEIPILTVNNKDVSARKVIGTDSIDAIGINKKVADRLSGADFDGDTVMVIPTHDKRGKVKIANREQLDGLKGFDSKSYQYDEPPRVDKDGNTHYYRNGKEFRIMRNTNNQMGRISNLISDMTLLGANDDELARAVRHSMVVIDAEKHKLDYKQSEIDNNISALKRKYQRSVNENGEVEYGGASTIISKAKGRIDVLKRRGQPKINQKGKDWYDPSKEEGALIYTPAKPKDLYYADSTLDKKTGMITIYTESGKKITYHRNDEGGHAKFDPVPKINDKTGEITFTNKDGSITYRKKARTFKSTKMAETDDANTLVSDNRHKMELLYADYANSMKSLANKARKEMVYTELLQTSPAAKKIYAKEVSALEARLNEARKNSPKERAALRLSNVEKANRIKENPEMKDEDKRKMSQQLLSKYRNEVGTITRKNRAIVISDKEWEAIQAGAISDNKLKKILEYTDPESLRERAMPKNKTGLSQAQINRIKSLANSNFTLQQIANKMNISTSAVSKYLKGE